MRGILTLLLLGSLQALSLSQSMRVGSEPTPIMSASPFTRTGISAWSSGGASVAEDGIQAAALSNPALTRLDGPTVYVEAGKRLGTTWILDFDYDGQFIVPAFASLGTSVENISLEIGYSNSYNEHLSSSLPITTAQLPDGTGEFDDFERTVNVHTYFGSMSYSPTNAVSFGATVGVNNVRTKEGIGRVSERGNGNGAMLNFGVLLKADEGLSFGASFRYSTSTTVSLSYEGPQLLQLPSDSGRSYYKLSPAQASYNAALPWIVEAGICWNAGPAFTILSSVEFERWSHIAPSFRDVTNIHLGAAFRVSPLVSLRCGFFTQLDPITSTSEYIDQNVLTAGVEWTANESVVLSAGILDSHLFGKSAPSSTFFQTNNSFHQTYFSSAVGYRF